jgi:hypothetical protein
MRRRRASDLARVERHVIDDTEEGETESIEKREGDVVISCFFFVSSFSSFRSVLSLALHERSYVRIQHLERPVQTERHQKVRQYTL